MILLLQDGSTLQLNQNQIREFQFLSTISYLEKNKQEQITLKDVDSKVVRHLFENCNSDFELAPENDSSIPFGFVRDLIALNFYLGGSEKLESLLQKKLEHFIVSNKSDVVCCALGLQNSCLHQN